MVILLPLSARGPDTVKVTKVTGHATEADVEQGRARLEDRLVNIEADTAADLGRRHQSEAVMDARRALLNVRELWYPILLQLHRFVIAISRVSVNRGGGVDRPHEYSCLGSGEIAASSAGSTLGSMLPSPCFLARLAC